MLQRLVNCGSARRRLWVISGPMGPTEHLALAVNPFTGGASGLRHRRATSARENFMARLSPWHFYALICALTALYQLIHLAAGR